MSLPMEKGGRHNAGQDKKTMSLRHRKVKGLKGAMRKYLEKVQLFFNIYFTFICWLCFFHGSWGITSPFSSNCLCGAGWIRIALPGALGRGNG